MKWTYERLRDEVGVGGLLCTRVGGYILTTIHPSTIRYIPPGAESIVHGMGVDAFLRIVNEFEEVGFDNDLLRDDVRKLADRVSICSELLGKKANREAGITLTLHVGDSVDDLKTARKYLGILIEVKESKDA